jgi:hypothetical protein
MLGQGRPKTILFTVNLVASHYKKLRSREFEVAYLQFLFGDKLRDRISWIETSPRSATKSNQKLLIGTRDKFGQCADVCLFQKQVVRRVVQCCNHQTAVSVLAKAFEITTFARSLNSKTGLNQWVMSGNFLKS